MARRSCREAGAARLCLRTLPMHGARERAVPACAGRYSLGLRARQSALWITADMNLRRLVPHLFALTFALLPACIKEGEGTFLYQVRNTSVSVSANTQLQIRERWLVFLADELTTGQGGTDFNGDTFFDDQVPVVVNMATRTEVVLPVSAREVAILGAHVFLVVDEAQDRRDWSGDGDTLNPDELVLLRTPALGATFATLTFVKKLSRVGSGPRMVVTRNGGLYFMEDDSGAALVAPETSINLVRIASGAPTTPLRLLNDDALNVLRPQLAGEENGMVFAVLDETAEARVLNGDGNVDDAFVLALINSEDATPRVKSTAQAMASLSAPVRALKVSTSDFVVAFLVDEAAQELGSLNNYANTANGNFTNWRPSHCAQNDTDSTDQVLHFVRYGAWFAGSQVPINVGFAGTDRVLIVRTALRTYVASVVPESDDGNCVTNGLNNDGDTTDRVLRWIATTDPLGSNGVYISATGLVALANAAGGTRGVTDLNGRFIAVVDEAADERSYDGSATDNTLVGWLNPDSGNSAAWTFDHGTPAGIQATGTRWMGEQPDRLRVGVAFQEALFGASINAARDADTLDSVPTFSRFDPGNASDLDFPGPAVAADDDNAGIVIVAGIALYRVDENADNFDWNGDGDKNDFVLFRTNVSSISDSFAVSTLNSLSTPAAFVGIGVGQGDDAVGVAFLADESMISAGNSRDLNGDGDFNDFVVRWMRVGP